MASRQGRIGANNMRPATIAQAIPMGYRVEDPTVPFQGNSLGDTVYTLLQNIWDPRSMQTSVVTAGKIVTSNRYTTVSPGYDYLGLSYDYLNRMVFAARPGRQEPDPNIIIEMLDNICDISRMLGILLTAYTSFRSRDPEMFSRSRQLDLHTSVPEMMTILKELPLPRNIALASIKYIGLYDVANSDNYQNIGFLVNGDFNSFLALYANVRGRSLALNWLRQLYPSIGEIGDPGSGTSAGKIEAFINCGLKSSTGNYSSWTNVGGGDMEVKQLASSGILHAVAIGTQMYTQTGYAIPGGGVAGVASQRTPFPYLCRWDGTRDAVITRSASQVYNVTGSVITAQAVQDVDLIANLGHEYNMMSSETQTQQIVSTFDGTTGVSGVFPQGMTLENSRYRVTTPFSLSQLSYRLDGNIMDGIGTMLMAEAG